MGDPLPLAVWTKDTFVSACHTHTHTHTDTLAYAVTRPGCASTHVPCALTRLVLPIGARVL